MLNGGASVEGARVVVVGWLRARRGELVDAIFARVRGDAFDRAGAQDAEYVAGLRAAVAAALEFVLDGIEHGEQWGGSVPVVALEQARRVAGVGVSLDTVLRRYVVGHTLLEEYVMEEADRDDWDGWALDRRSALRGVLRAQASALDRLLQAITVAYENESQGAGRSPERRRYERVKGLLEGGAVEGADLGYELGGWHLGVIAVGKEAGRAVGELAVRIDRRLLSVAAGREGVWAWVGGRDRFAFVDVERIAGMNEMGSNRDGSHPPVVLAVGEPAWGIEGWRLTHRQAQAALVVALRRGGRETVTLTRYADVALLATALKDEALAGALVDIYIAPLEDSANGGPVLRQTLHAYFAAERSVSSAAAALGVVRKTVENRLRTIEEKLGRSLHPCPAELEVALLLNELAPAPRPPNIPTVE